MFVKRYWFSESISELADAFGITENNVSVRLGRTRGKLHQYLAQGGKHILDRKTDKLVSAIGDIDTAYLEEALDFNRTNADRRKRTRFPKLSAACCGGADHTGRIRDRLRYQ